ncbi:MAG: hydrogenase nickel incorporation protein HypB [Chthonomonadales bacterium]
MPRKKTTTVPINQSVHALNDRIAADNRRRFKQHGLLVLNLLSSPGSGKTALLERTLVDLKQSLRMGVIVGDLQTDNDAQRLAGKGAPVVQITTQDVCHLEADMVSRAASTLPLQDLDVLFIENVGNLVCPATFDLGEDLRVVLVSVTEGEDKPLKYPVIFKNAHVVLITKMDLAEAVGFDREAATRAIRRIAPQATLMEISAKTGAGMDQWYALLKSFR